MLNFIDTILDANLIDWGVWQRCQSIRQRKKTNIMSEYAPDILLDDMSETMAK